MPKKLILILMTVAMIIGIVEIAARVYYYSRALSPNVYARYDLIRKPLTGMTMIPNINEKRSSSLNTTFSTNRDGFRGSRNPEIPKPQGLKRVICLGASSVFGVGVSDDTKSWPAQLEHALKTNHRVEVVNLGLPSINSAQTLNVASLYGMRLSPDILIFYQGWNDMTNYVQCPEHWIDNRILSEESYFHCTDWGTYMAHFNGDTPIIKHSAVLFAVKRALHKYAPKPYTPEEGAWRKERFLLNYRVNLRSVLGLCRGRGIPMIIMPLIGRNPGPDDLRDLVNKEVRAFAALEKDVILVDLEKYRKEHQKKEKWFVDPIHPSDTACRHISGLLAPVVSAHLSE